MHIDDDHLYHGAALIQIAEHPQFTAINNFKIKNQTMRNAYKINDDIGVYLKYSTKPTAKYSEYVFTFLQDHMDQLAQLNQQIGRLYLALLCVGAREICCLTYEEFMDLIDRRKRAKGADEDAYTFLVTAPKRMSLRAYVNKPNKKGVILGKAKIVKKSAFPNMLFA